MSNVKMSDVFNHMKYVNGRDIDTGELVDTYGGWWATFNSKQSAMHAATAINEHDKLVEQVVQLRSALTKIVELSEFKPACTEIQIEAEMALEETC